MVWVKKMVAFALGVGLSQAFDGDVPSLRRPESLAFAAPAASFIAGKTADGKCGLLAPTKSSRMPCAARMSPLMMGRAAAVRAATKGKTDAAKAKLNARYGKQIVMLVKVGGSDPVANRALSKLIDQAKSAGVPKANIDNILKKASAKDSADYKESVFEAYAHGGVGFVITVLTDNNNRASADVKTVMNKQKLKPAESGSVAFNFDKLGMITVLTGLDEDSMTDAALDAGAQDLAAISEPETEADAGFYIYTAPTDLMGVADVLREAGMTVKDTEFVYKGKAPIACSEGDEELNFNAMDAFEELDDVDAVFHNME
mmetsp:Transcript_27320/g.22968  ORF Transcript_27320/g.22968 Transcript_27320/m.22968 type:complete len:315 (-) Transcript_27320:107-1051(-)